MSKQLDLNIYKGKRGGRRPGAGRKRKHSVGVAHGSRELVSMQTPLHINFKYKIFIRTLTGERHLLRAIENAETHGLLVTHYSLESNHIHLIAEAASNEKLTKGMRSLTATLVKLHQRGGIQIERYHLHVLRTLKEVKNAVDYVLNNHERHTGRNTKEFRSPRAGLGPGRSWLLNQCLKGMSPR